MRILSGATVTVRRLLDAVLLALILVVVFGVILAKVVPVTGRETIIVGGRSMEPAIPMGSAIIVGRVGDVRRFPTCGHFARHNGTAPIEASSGPIKRHRLNPRGDRQLNHAMHMAAVTQVRHDTPGRAYYLRKQAEGKSRKEALRALKRRISDAVYQRLIADTHR